MSAFVPNEIITEALQLIKNHYLPLVPAESQEGWNKFLLYYEKTWVKNDTFRIMISYFNEKIERINNNIGRWNRHFKDLVGKHTGNLYTIIEGLKLDDILS